MEPKHLFEYARRINDKIIINESQVEHGMFLDVNYKKPNPKHPTQFLMERYILLVLNPNHLHKLHAISCKEISQMVFERFTHNYKIVPSKISNKIWKLDIPIVDFNAPPRASYVSDIKQKMHLLGNCYRTYDLKQFSRIYAVDFDFLIKDMDLGKKENPNVITDQLKKQDINKPKLR